MDRHIDDLLDAAKERIAELEAERLAILKLLPVKSPDGRFGDPEDAAYTRGRYDAYSAVADALGVELPHKWQTAVEGPSLPEPQEPTPDPRYRVTTEKPSRYLRSSTGVLHLRQDGPEDDGLSYHYTRCGWYSELGREAVPLIVGEDARVCKRCHVIEPG